MTIRRACMTMHAAGPAPPARLPNVHLVDI